MTTDYPTVSISSQPIELCKLLKIANMVSGGGEAKIVISEGYVYLNGEVEFQKRKKVYAEDIVEFNGELVQVKCSNKAKDPAKVNSLQNSSNKAAKTQTKSNSSHNKQVNKPAAQQYNLPNGQHNMAQNEPEPLKPLKRRPISF